MFEFTVVTIFPELFIGFSQTSLMGKAIDNGLLSIQCVDLRNFTHDRHRSVDDDPYGGGAGMVMRPGPIFEMFDGLPPCHKVLMTPQGSRFKQETAHRLSGMSKVMLFCEIGRAHV